MESSRLALLMAAFGSLDYQIDGRHQRTARQNVAPLAVTPLHANAPKTGRKLTRAKRKALKAVC